MKKLSHIDDRGRAVMVDVSAKKETGREALATATVKMKPETLEIILAGDTPKGDVYAAARIAGIMAAKKTPALIPLCHPLNISSVEVEFETDEMKNEIRIYARAKITRSEEHTSELQSH